jgi:hypothetical protein
MRMIRKCNDLFLKLKSGLKDDDVSAFCPVRQVAATRRKSPWQPIQGVKMAVAHTGRAQVAIKFIANDASLARGEAVFAWTKGVPVRFGRVVGSGW